MKNIYVTRMPYLSEELLKEAQTLDKTDTLYIITDKNGTMPITLYPHFKTLICNVQMIFADTTEEALAFSLGFLCKDNNGFIYFIIPKTDAFSCLKDKTYEVGKNITQIIVQQHFITTKKETPVVKKSRTTKTITPTHTKTKTPVKRTTKPQTVTTSEVAPVKETDMYVVNTKKKTALNSTVNNINKRPTYIPEKFIAILEKMDTNVFDIDKDIIFLYDAIKAATDADASLLFQLQMCFGNERKDAIYKILKSKFNTLKRSIL